MTWLPPAVIATLAGSIILTIVYVFLYAQDHERHLKIWAGAWAVYALRFVFQLAAIQLDSGRVVFQYGVQFCALLSGMLILWGTYIFLDKVISRWWIGAAVVVAVWITIAIPSEQSFLVQTLLPFTFLGIIYIWIGRLLLRCSTIENAGRWVTGWAFIIWGIHKIDYPFLKPVEWFAPWGYLLGATLEFAVAIGMLLIYFQRMRSNLTESMHKFRSIVEQSKDGIILVDKQGLVVEWNQGQERITGIPRSEAIGQSLLEVQLRLVPEERRSSAQQSLSDDVHQSLDMMAGVSSKTSLTNEFEIQRVDGQRRMIQMTVFAIQTDNGAMMSGMVHDVTDARKAEKNLRQRQNEVESLLEIGRDLSRTLNFDRVASLVAQRLVLILNIDDCTILQLDETKKVLRPIFSIGENAEKTMTVTIQVGQGLTGHCVADNRPILANNAHLDARTVKIFDTHHEIEHVMVVPLVSEGGPIGAILVRRTRPEQFTQENLRLLVAVSQQAASAIQNARLHDELKTRSENLQEAIESRTVELQRTVGRTKVILDNSPDAVLLLGVNGAIETANQAFFEVFGYALDEVYGQTPTMLADPSSASDFSNMLRHVLDRGQPGRLELMAWRRNGETFDADAALAPVKKDDTMVGLVCSVRDITAFKEVARMKDAFVSNVSHELRTPITSIKLYHNLLVRSPEQHAVYMPRLERETQRLANIIEDLLLLSRLDQGRANLNFQWVNLNRLVSQHVIDRTVLAESKDIYLSFKEYPNLPSVKADPGFVSTVLSVLLTNAINYTPKGGRITVSTSAAQNGEQTWVQFRVSDNGPGIPVDEQAQLFERFARGKAGRDSGAPGTGLGLAIAQEIVGYHKGRIEVASTGIPGEGAAFTVWLPVEAH